MIEHRRNETEPVPQIVTTFTVIDLDRVLFKTKNFYENVMLPNVARDCRLHTDDEELISKIVESARRAEIKNRGLAFDFCEFMQTQWQQHNFGDFDYRDLARRLVDGDDVASGRPLETKDIFADDATALIKAVAAEPDSQWGIMTSGGNPTQTLKLMVSGGLLAKEVQLIPRALIIQTENKAELIASQWYSDETGLFLVPEQLSDGRKLFARRVRVIDDKPKNLVIPKGLVPKGKILPVLARRPDGDQLSEPGASPLWEIASGLQLAA
jgi:hypothetical protein